MNQRSPLYPFAEALILRHEFIQNEEFKRLMGTVNEEHAQRRKLAGNDLFTRPSKPREVWLFLAHHST